MNGIEEESRRNFLKWILIVLVVIFGLGVIGGGIFVYQKAIKEKNEGVSLISATPTSPSLTPTPTSSVGESSGTNKKEEINKKELKIKILNGTGVPGSAGKAASFLESLGYKGIKTGNADSFDYEKSLVKIKEEKKSFLESIIKDLSQKYEVAEETETLSNEEEFDVIIILGKPLGI